MNPTSKLIELKNECQISFSPFTAKNYMMPVKIEGFYRTLILFFCVKHFFVIFDFESVFKWNAIQFHQNKLVGGSCLIQEVTQFE